MLTRLSLAQIFPIYSPMDLYWCRLWHVDTAFAEEGNHQVRDLLLPNP